MDANLKPAFAFGALLREDEKAAQFYDGCTPEQKQAILLQLSNVRDMDAFVHGLPNTAP